jgi:hypothetical protein
VRNDSFEGPLRGERTDVKFIKNVISKREPKPTLILPGEMGTDHLRRSVDPLRLESRGRIWVFSLLVQTIEVKRAGFDVLQNPAVVPSVVSLKRENPFGWRDDMYLDPFCERGPKVKLASTFPEICGPQPDSRFLPSQFSPHFSPLGRFNRESP